MQTGSGDAAHNVMLDRYCIAQQQAAAASQCSQQQQPEAGLACVGQFSNTVQDSTWATRRAFLASLEAMASILHCLASVLDH